LQPQLLSTLDLGTSTFGRATGAAPRTQICEGVTTANDAPPSARIPFHHELGQSRERPSYLLFHCLHPASVGGETTLCDSRQVARHVQKSHPSFAASLDDGIVYRRVLPEEDDTTSPIGRSWRATFGAKTRHEVEKKMSEQNMQWKWRSDNALWTQTSPLPAFRHHPVTGDTTFCNSIIAAYHGWTDTRNVGERSVLYRDETTMPAHVMKDVATFAHENQYAIKWQPGDVLLLDNQSMMHGRKTFDGERRVLVRMLT